MAVNKLTKKIKYLLVMYGICTALFAMDACAYIFRGNYVKSVIRSYGITISALLYKVTLLLYLLTGVCILINFLNGWMFGFDENNYYHRNAGWYVYSLLFILGTAVLMYLLFSIRTQLDTGLFISLVLYMLVPFIAIIFQILFYGISISNIGLAVTLTLFFIFYLKQQAEEKQKFKIYYAKERNMIISMLMLTLMIICMSTSIVTCVAHMQKIAHENSIKDSQNMAHLVRSDIENSFLAFLTSAEMISSD